jgi:hypothetical protein
LSNKQTATFVEETVKEIKHLTRNVISTKEKIEVTINYCESKGINPKHFIKLMYL